MDLEEYKQNLPRLPISKCKKIARTDPEYMLTSQTAFAATAFSTELFVQMLAEETCSLAQIHNKTKTLRLNYEDLSTTIRNLDKFQFLSDVVPQTENLASLVRENKVRYTIVNPSPEVDIVSEDEEDESIPDTEDQGPPAPVPAAAAAAAAESVPTQPEEVQP
ncbi:DNA polymerase epsilon subunit C [Kluyveromyces marxianus]|uniref:DNA polymerase epsilon subunit C n=2 Tax=Kluyveromyces marxianus TaxID=4911 RepID=W0TAR7_KLUMD|nr:DNA polymerase epsilon subunit C [Kluyveromyces marxianus DMKU3-1042]QGN16461.1 DNA polymerase epsilon subunit C [Kluyveromyces marxianus]BAO40732.1 DNA polymerase epsilon subunit C [Kluyveromyces marxianus DMKU3-1042]